MLSEEALQDWRSNALQLEGAVAQSVIGQQQVARLKAFKADRDQELVARRLEELREVARGTGNLLPPIRAALKDRASLGEVCGAMQDVFGSYTPTF